MIDTSQPFTPATTHFGERCSAASPRGGRAPGWAVVSLLFPVLLGALQLAFLQETTSTKIGKEIFIPNFQTVLWLANTLVCPLNAVHNVSTCP